MNLMIIIIVILLVSLGIAAIVFRLFLSKKPDKFESKFIKTHKGEFVGSFHYNPFCLRDYDD
jgi:hypothetical protein